MKTTTVNYETLIVTFAEPIRILDNIFDDAEAWGVVSALYIERRYFLFVTYLIISRYRKAQT